MNTSPHPVSAVCPQCGSSRYRKVDPDWQPAIVNDRVCLDCQTRYSPPPPQVIGVFVIVVGAGCIAAGCWFFYRLIFGGDAAYVNPLYSFMMVAAGVLGILVWLKRPRGA